MKKIIITFLLPLTYITNTNAQATTGEALRTVRESTTLGFGTCLFKDTYLSPFTYTGWGGSIQNDRTTTIKPELSRRMNLSVDIDATRNPAQNINDFGTIVDYSLAYHYHYLKTERLNLMIGGAPHIMGGFIYNTYNGNNPISAKIDADLSLSFAATYLLKIKKRPITLSASGIIPIAGIFFAPPYGISYYEMISEKNTGNIVALSTFHNKFAITALLTADIPFGNLALRLAYRFKYYASDIKDIQTTILSNTFMIGWVKEFYIK